MGSQPADRRAATRYVATFRIRLGYADLDSFLDGYAVNISKGGIYVPTKQPREKGTDVRFELLLKDGSAAVVGVGKVAWSKPFDPSKPGERYGMGVQFVGLEGASEGIVERAMAWRERHLSGDDAGKEIAEREIVPSAAPAAKAAEAPEPAEPKPEAKAEEPEAEAKAEEKPAEPSGSTKAGGPLQGRSKRISLGSVDKVLASLRSKKSTGATRAVGQPAEEKPAGDEQAAPATETPARDEATAPEAPAEGAAPAAEATPSEAPAPEAPAAAAAAPFEEPEEPPTAEAPPDPAAAEPIREAAPRPEEPPQDEGLPSLDDLEAALASVSRPPTPPREMSGEIPITEGAPAFTHSDPDAPAQPSSPAADEGPGLDLPSWDDEAPAELLSDRPGPRKTIDLEIPGYADVGAPAAVYEDDLDLDSLPLGVAPAEAPPIDPGAAQELFSDMGEQPAVVEVKSTPSDPELPVVGGVVSDRVGNALREKLAARASDDDEAPTSIMTEVEAEEMRASFVAPARASLADLPPPPDMPAPIPATPPEEKKKSGLLGRIFGRKKK